MLSLFLLISYRFSKRLEEYSFRGNSINYLFFLLYGIVILTVKTLNI